MEKIQLPIPSRQLKGNQFITYAILTKEDAKQASQLLAKIFSQQELLDGGLNITFQQNKQFYDGQFQTQRINTTIIAKSSLTNKIIAVGLAEGAHLTFQLTDKMGKRQQPTLQFLESYSQKFVKQFKCEKNEVLKGQSCVVQKEYAKKGIIMDIGVNGIFVAILLGYRYLFTQITSPEFLNIWVNKLKYPIFAVYDPEQNNSPEISKLGIKGKIHFGFKDLNEIISQGGKMKSKL